MLILPCMEFYHNYATPEGGGYFKRCQDLFYGPQFQRFVKKVSISTKYTKWFWASLDILTSEPLVLRRTFCYFSEFTLRRTFENFARHVRQISRTLLSNYIIMSVAIGQQFILIPFIQQCYIFSFNLYTNFSINISVGSFFFLKFLSC